VEQERVTSESVAVSSSTPDYLLTLVSGKKLSDAGRSQLEAIIALKRKVAAAESALESGKTAMDELTQDQTRLRENIDSLNKVSGQEDKVRQYSTRLNENEVKLAQMRGQRNEMNLQVFDLNAQVAAAVGKLQF